MHALTIRIKLPATRKMCDKCGKINALKNHKKHSNFHMTLPIAQRARYIRSPKCSRDVLCPFWAETFEDGRAIDDKT